MSEVQARSHAPASRGRGGARGGRGGRSDGRSVNRRANGDKSTTEDFASIDDDGDVSQLRKQYGDKVDTIKELFPDWSDADIVYALQETNGDLEVAATRISEGTISQWGEVSKPKKTTKPKVRDSAATTGLTESSGNSRPTRGGRVEGGRGGRGGRGSERARGGRGRASTHATTNGHRSKENQELSIPTEEASGWGNTTSNDNTATNEWGTNAWGATEKATAGATATDKTPAPTTTTTTTTTSTAAKTTSTPAAETAAPKPKTWASMLRQSTAPKPAPKPQDPPISKPAEHLEPLPPAESTPAEPDPIVEEIPQAPVEEHISTPAEVETPQVVVAEVALLPPEDDLTKVNLEQLPDESHPPATATAASTAADSWDPRQASQQSASVTPNSAAQAQHQPARPSTSGFATTALKATERSVRVPSYQRRVLEQEEAVRLPGNREVDRAAVQFGAFSLNGVEDDIDGEREEAETRAQPPSDSPVQPRASLPPIVQPASVPEGFPAAASQKPVTSLPQSTTANPVAPPTGPSAVTTSQPPQAPLSNQQYGRYGQANVQDPTFPPKPYDTFGQPATTTSAGAFDGYPAPTTQAPSQPSAGAFSSAPNEYSSYYTADQHSRGSYNNYYGQAYGQQQGGQGHSEGPSPHQRPFGGYNTSQNNDNLSQYPQSAAQPTRYGAAAAATDAHNSGHNTPNPAGQSQQPQAGQNNGPQSNLHQQPPANNYSYGHPYYSSPFYAQYMNSSYGGYGQGGYGGAPYGKGGVYGQPHQYGISHQSPYDHSSSPATSAFGQSALTGRDSALGSSIDNYGRAGSAQSGAPGLGNSGFGGAHDAFNRAGSSYQSQSNFNAPNTQSGSSDELKPYGESKVAGGPSPSLGAAARPGSATNNTPGQSGLPPPQSSGQGIAGYGGYPSHLQSQAGGLHGNQAAGSAFGQGGAGGQGPGNNPYGGGYSNYGANQGFGNYGGRQQGWGNNYQ